MLCKDVSVVKTCNILLFAMLSSCRLSDEKHPVICPDKIVDTLADAVEYMFHFRQ